MRLAAYGFMLLFDIVIFTGTAYLVDQRAWSPWWFLFALIVAGLLAPGRNTDP